MIANQKKNNFKTIVNKGIKIGLIIFVIGSPFSISLAQLGFISALVFWGIKVIFVKGTKIKGTFIDIFLLTLLIGILLGLIFSIDVLKSIKDSRPLWLISMMYLLYNNVDLEQGKKLLKILLISSVLIGIYGIFQSLTGIDFFGKNIGKYGPFLHGAKGGFGLHLTYGGYQMMTAVILLAIVMYALKSFNKKTKILIIISAWIVVLSVILSFARTAWLGLLAGSTVLAGFGFFIKSKKQIFIVLSIFLIFVILFFSFTGFKKRVFRIFTDLKYSVRTELWGGALEMIRDHPIFGVGTSMFSKHFLKYRPDYKGSYCHPHNDFLSIYLRAGIIGFIGFILLFFVYFKKMIKFAFKKYKSNKLNKLDFSITIGIVSSFIAFLVAGLGQNYFTDSENEMLLWFLFGFSMLLYYKSEKNKIVK